MDKFSQFKLKKWQNLALNAWLKEEIGIITAVPGSGKTHLGLALMSLYPDASFLVVVPSQELAKQWFRRIKENTPRMPSYMQNSHDFNIEKTTVEIVNTIIKRESAFNDPNSLPDYIILDEIHRYLGFKFRKVLTLKTKKGNLNRIGLTATIPDKKIHPLDYKHLIDQMEAVVYNYTLEEALKEKNIVPYRIIIFKVALTDEENVQLKVIEDKINKNKQILKKKLAKQGIELNIGMLLRRKLPPGYNLPETNFLRKLYLDRRHLNFKARNKLYFSVLLAQKLLEDESSHIIIFTMTIEVADDIAKQLEPNTEVVHSKRNKDDNNTALDRFRDKFSRILVVVRTVDEGVDLPSLTHALIVANSKQIRQMIQRVGRILRVHDKGNFKKKEAQIYIFEAPGDEFNMEELKEGADHVNYQVLR